MEKNYSKFGEIKIKEDLPIKFIGRNSLNKDVYGVFEKLNIKTLEDLFIAYNNGDFNDKRKSFFPEIKGQTELLMAYYMNTPLVADEILETRINFESYDTINEQFENNKFCSDLGRAGISTAEQFMLYRYCINKQGKIMSTYAHSTLSIMSIMQRFADDEEYQAGIIATATSYTKDDLLIIQNLKFKSKLYENYMEHKKDLEQGGTGFKNVNGAVDFEVVGELKSQMNFLLNARKNLDTQIELLQSQLTSVKNAGGIRK